MGYHWVEGGREHDWACTMAIHPWETNVLNYTGPGKLHLRISNMTDTSQVFNKGSFKDRPKRYLTDLGLLEWVPKD